jgi:hypothetical protein
MSVHHEPERRRYVVRWREGGRNPVTAVQDEEEAAAFDARLAEHRRKRVESGSGRSDVGSAAHRRRPPLMTRAGPRSGCAARPTP